MRSLQIFAVGSVFTYRALFQWLHPSAYVFNKIGFPLLQLTFFAVIGSFGGARPLEFYLIGNVILVAYRPMFTIATSVANERWTGTLPYVLGSPAPRVALFFGRASFHVVDGLLDVVIAFAYAALVFGLDLSRADWGGLAAATLVATIGASALGLALGAAAYVILDAPFLANTAMFMLLLLTGANIPLGELPPWLLPVSWALPLTRSVEAARSYVAGADTVSALPLLAGDLAVAAVWAVSGYLLFSAFEERARRRGTLDRV